MVRAYHLFVSARLAENTLRYNVIREFGEVVRKKNDTKVPVNTMDSLDKCLLSMSGWELLPVLNASSWFAEKISTVKSPFCRFSQVVRVVRAIGLEKCVQRRHQALPRWSFHHQRG